MAHDKVFQWILSLDFQSPYKEILDIWMIVDCFGKQTYFLLVKKTIRAKHMANMFMFHIFMHHGLSTSIVFDQDPCMKSLFWKGLFKNLETKLNFYVLITHKWMGKVKFLTL